MGVNIDRFSLLDDSLMLSIIVSSLPFKDAVKTSILSKDWENVCKLTRNIEFNELFFILQIFEPVFPIIPEKYWIDTIEAYKCVKSHLKKVEITGFKRTKNELCVITYFLLRGETLRKMSINLLKGDVNGEVGLNVTARREAARSLLTIPKASTNLELLIC
ncbi:putative FBD domain-containing protein [Medicago truncatula]|uniref:FBD protein n=1 Tax=Medicago truncatula TaxID=3880 RepID=G7KBT3_MEDTR|nr:FBD protein [Medicago truncatula]RHN56991.1 putative FBD domain-containing protein [Medicago truncatula]